MKDSTKEREWERKGSGERERKKETSAYSTKILIIILNFVARVTKQRAGNVCSLTNGNKAKY